MIRAIRRTGRSAGFTLLELGVSITILAILAAIVVPPWANYRARMKAFAAAQELRAELAYIQSRSIDLEQTCSLVIDNSGQYSVYVFNPATNAQELYKRIYPSWDGLTLSPTSGTLVFAQRGWVDEGLSTLSSGTFGGYRVWTITVSATGLTDCPVRVYYNGKVEVR